MLWGVSFSFVHRDIFSRLFERFEMDMCWDTIRCILRYNVVYFETQSGVFWDTILCILRYNLVYFETQNWDTVGSNIWLCNPKQFGAPQPTAQPATRSLVPEGFANQVIQIVLWHILIPSDDSRSFFYKLGCSSLYCFDIHYMFLEMFLEIDLIFTNARISHRSPNRNHLYH